MQISVTRQGGYAGGTETIVLLDTAKMSPASRERVEELLQESGFFGLPANAVPGAVGADLFRYEVTVQEGGRTHKVSFADDGGPEAAGLRTLVDRLAQMG